MEPEASLIPERLAGQASKVVGLYQMFLRRNLEHFFPDAVLDLTSDRSFIHVNSLTDGERYRIDDDPDGFGVAIEWLRSRYLFAPSSPSPFLPGRAAADRRDRQRPGPPLPRPLRPRGGPPGRDVPVRLRRLHRHRVPRPARIRPDPRGARGAPRGGALDLREPAGFHRGPAPGDRGRPGHARPGQPRGGAPLRRPPDRDQGVPPALRRRPDGLPRRPPRRPRPGRRRRPTGPTGPRGPSPWRAPARGPTATTPGRPGRATTSAWCSRRRRRSRSSRGGPWPSRSATPAGGCSTSPPSSPPGARRWGLRPARTWPAGSSRPP